MKAKITFLSLMLCCLFPATSFAQIMQVVTQQDALAIAQKQFPGQDVDYFILQDNSMIEWTIFVDAEPMKGWEHDCYILTIPKRLKNSIDSAIPTSIIRRKLPPSDNDNYVPLYTKNRYGDNASSKPSVAKAPQSNDATVANRTYAIILSGGVNKISNYERYWNDCSFIYQTLVNKYGIPKENIYPLMSDGNDPAEDMRLASGRYASQPLDLDNDGVDEIELSATKLNIQNTLDVIKDRIQKDDHLFFFVIDHGGTTDNKSNSYIYLWGSETLFDNELAEMLTPFTDKFVNVNVVLGQCYSGGFNDNLTKMGCVVSSASTGSEQSWACTDIPYDEFVYHWTCAVNGANHKNIKVNADVDNNGCVTMEEAFYYAKTMDRQSDEHPQYVSTPISVGEDLAFNNLAKSIDLYIKDNPEDTGKVPNMTTDEFWKSPSIWIRNQDDGIEIHENPIYAPDHMSVMIYVKIHNRGKEKYTGGQYLHAYWARASTAFRDEAWLGRELYDNKHVTGGHLYPQYIDPIEPGESRIVGVPWGLPKNLIESDDIDNHHFCLKTKILSSHIDEKYEEGKLHFDLRCNNSHAQKNVSVIHKEDISKETLVFVRNVNNKAENYTLELIPSTEYDQTIYDVANVELGLSPTIHEAWERGGFKSHDVVRLRTALTEDNNKNDINLTKVRFNSPQSKLQAINLMGNEFDMVSLKFDFVKFEPTNKEYTFDLIQRDENGVIIGGETFIVESPKLVFEPIKLDSLIIDDGQLLLNVDNKNDFKRIKWIDNQGNTIGDSESIVVTPTRDNNKYTVIASTMEGDVATKSISLDAAYGIKSVSTSISQNKVVVELKNKATCNSTISIISIFDGRTKAEESIPEGENRISIDVTDLVKGIYAIVYTVDGAVIDQKKIDIK